MVSPSPLDSLIEQVHLMMTKLDDISTQTTRVKKTADELKASRRKTWRTIAFIAIFTLLDVSATVVAFYALSTVHSLIAQVICPTDALFLKTYNPARGDTYPGGRLGYMTDMHSIYTQYTVVLSCNPRVTDPTVRMTP